MKILLFAAAAAFTLGLGTACAGSGGGGGRGTGHGHAIGGGLAGGNIPSNIYGSQAFRDHSHDPEVHFLGPETTFGRLFGRSNSDQAPPRRGG